jgi:uncharacterized protein YndB with AHSA1/START domain
MTTITHPGVSPMLISKSVHISRSPEDTFGLFVDQMGRWWPSHTGKYTYDKERAQDVILEAHVGGRFFERYKDGDEFTIGQVLECDRPARILFTWAAGFDPPTEVEVRFTPEANGTRVDLEHRGADGAAAGTHGFDDGWTEVLSYFVAAA